MMLVFESAVESLSQNSDTRGFVWHLSEAKWLTGELGRNGPFYLFLESKVGSRELGAKIGFRQLLNILVLSQPIESRDLQCEVLAG